MAESPKRRPRRRFDDDFKAQAVRLVLDEGKSVGSVARDLDLTETALREWVKRALADRTHGKTGLTTAEREELARLRRENRILREEREILKNFSRVMAHPTCRPATPRGTLARTWGCGRPLSGDITNPLKNMVRGWLAYVSMVTLLGDPV